MPAAPEAATITSTTGAVFPNRHSENRHTAKQITTTGGGICHVYLPAAISPNRQAASAHESTVVCLYWRQIHMANDYNRTLARIIVVKNLLKVTALFTTTLFVKSSFLNLLIIF